eukprot:362961-Chlamydomonas_euryale.AAC.6
MAALDRQKSAAHRPHGLLPPGAARYTQPREIAVRSSACVTRSCGVARAEALVAGRWIQYLHPAKRPVRKVSTDQTDTPAKGCAPRRPICASKFGHRR